MNASRKSDRPIVPTKRPNETGVSVEEDVEGRGRAKGNAVGGARARTQRRRTRYRALDRVREAAGRKETDRFTALWHHVYAIDHLREQFGRLKRQGAAGVDGETWQSYRENLEENLRDLSDRLQRGAYRAPPVRRAYIPKDDGRNRPIGVPRRRRY
jgi:hypothetical protein